MPGGKRVLVHAVEEALDDTEGDEPPDVDVRQLVRVRAIPLPDTLALAQAGV